MSQPPENDPLEPTSVPGPPADGPRAPARRAARPDRRADRRARKAEGRTGRARRAPHAGPTREETAEAAVVPTGDRRTALGALVMVLLTAGGLLLAATAGVATGRPDQPTEQITAAQRMLVCSGGIDGARQLSSTGGGVPSDADVPTDLQPVTSGAATAYAAQVARGGRWLAYASCPEPQASWWFVGLGGSSTHHSTVTLANPRSGDAVVDVNVYGPNGPVQAPGLHGIALASGATRTLDLQKLAPAAGDLAVSVTASRGLVTASSAEQFAPDFVTKPVSAFVPSQPAPARTQTLTGLPASSSGASLLVANPGQSEAVVQLKAIGSGGTFAPKGHESVTVAPGTVDSVDVGAIFDGKPVAVSLSSSTPVTATVRSTVGSDVAYAAGVAPFQGRAAAGVPQGTDAQVVLSSAGKKGTVVVTSYDKRGRRIGSTRVDVAAGSSVAHKLSGRTRAVQLQAADPTAVASLVLTDSAGAAATVLPPVQLEARTPGVIAGW